MAEVQETNTSSQIKLFGAKISLQQTPTPLNNDHHQLTDTKPDKMIPCPRCKSMETKFCYFNNYNVNQPRHFCKGCHRYWTAGGALRNVPVGAGRRKIKPPCVGMSDGGLFDDSGVRRLDFDTVVEWEAAERGGVRQLFAAKRRRCGSDSQSC